ncbi:MAG: hypothetical protein H8E34_10280, partial [Bacteroidetes bacterium]|nr:hypothetical protein [Bacteroidota bacterium]
MKTIKIKNRTYSKHIFKEMYLYRIAAIFLAIAFLLASCKKFEPLENSGSDITNVTLMRDLVISGDFDWKLFQTVDVNVVLPEDMDLKPIKISSLDGSKVYFKGYSEDGSKNVVTRATIPTYVDMVMVQFDDGTRYDPAIVPIINNTLNFDFNTMLKGGGDECCDGKVTWLTLEYLGT